MSPLLKTGVLVSIGVAMVSLTWMTIGTRSFRSDPRYAQPRGNRLTGILYAFGPAMMPWHKESAGRHLATYLLGIFYHTGIFAGILSLLLHVFDAVPGTITVRIIQVALAIGTFAGILLLLKRTVSPVLRAISCPDDYVSNILVDGFLVLGLLVSLGQPLATAWYGISIALFLYMPLGKIRHCAFFFTTRILHGIFFGRRGVFPGVSRINEGGTR